MKILHTISGFGNRSGGTSTCTYDLLRNINSNEIYADILTPDTKDKNDKLMGHGEDWIKIVNNDCISPYAYSKETKRFIENSNYDVYHTNGLWLHCNHITCSIARKKNKPYIITPHGMLYPAALKRSYWKKWPLLKLQFEKDIREATCIHATCKPELEHIRNFGYKGPIALIGNPADLPPYIDDLSGRKAETQIITFGFLGRLHPRKKVENLLYGVAGCPPENKKRMHLVIMGKGDDSYEQFLRNETKRLKLEENVEFKGFVKGREKFELLSELSALFVPSDFENFGMIVTEALAAGTPVFASFGTPWEILNEAKCGWWRERDPKNISEVMTTIANMSTEEINEMGERGKELVYKHFTGDRIASQMLTLYNWIINGGEKPDFVY